MYSKENRNQRWRLLGFKCSQIPYDKTRVKKGLRLKYLRLVRNLSNELIINFEQHNFCLNKINLSQTKFRQSSSKNAWTENQLCKTDLLTYFWKFHPLLQRKGERLPFNTKSKSQTSSLRVLDPSLQVSSPYENFLEFFAWA